MRATSRPALPTLAALSLALAAAQPAAASVFFFSTGNPDGRMAAASRPDSHAGIEIEAADDFALTTSTRIDSASFTGLLGANTDATNISRVVVEIYRVFPQDSDVGRTSGPPVFGTDKVPTRVNSPSDVAFDSRDSDASALSFTTQDLGAFTASNSVLNGIFPKPNQLTFGDGPVSGHEVMFDVDFATPFTLGPGHYFFVPQVQLDNSDNFLWLSAPRPITPPGTPFPLGFTDLQAWIRNANLDPDWLRIGTDITAQGPFNMTFSLNGQTVPEPGVWTLLIAGFAGAGAGLRRRRAKALPRA
jgi:hypothetical protein